MFFGVYVMIEVKLGVIMAGAEGEGVQPLRINIFSPLEIKWKYEY